MTLAQHLSMSVDWYTPACYVDAAREVMGGIDLDPASCPLANEVVKATHIFTKEDNGLEKPWWGRVFLNPPYGKTGGRSNQGIWFEKLRHEEQFEVEQAILLVNAATDTDWFQRVWEYSVCFTDHRIRFYGPGGTYNSPTHGNCFIYMGHRVEQFCKVFSQFGHCIG